MFRTIGIKSLRVGGGTADLPQYHVPGPADIDHLFAFAEAADVKVIYTLRLLNGSATDDARIARYIQQHYASRLVCFEIGNEPDWHSYHTSAGHARDPRIVESVADHPGTAFPSFLADWNDFASAVIRAAPGAKFTGPDTGSNWPVPGTKDTDFDGFRFNPKAYAIKAFEIGGHGTPIPVSVDHGRDVSLTAYGVRDGRKLFVTVINKEYGPTAKQADVTIRAPGISGGAEGMRLEAPCGDVTTNTGITLGGAAMTTDSWKGRWTDLGPCDGGQIEVQVSAASALVLTLDLK